MFLHVRASPWSMVWKPEALCCEETATSRKFTSVWEFLSSLGKFQQSLLFRVYCFLVLCTLLFWGEEAKPRKSSPLFSLWYLWWRGRRGGFTSPQGPQICSGFLIRHGQLTDWFPGKSPNEVKCLFLPPSFLSFLRKPYAQCGAWTPDSEIKCCMLSWLSSPASQSLLLNGGLVTPD